MELLDRDMLFAERGAERPSQQKAYLKSAAPNGKVALNRDSFRSGDEIHAPSDRSLSDGLNDWENDLPWFVKQALQSAISEGRGNLTQVHHTEDSDAETVKLAAFSD